MSLLCGRNDLALVLTDAARAGRNNRRALHRMDSEVVGIRRITPADNAPYGIEKYVSGGLKIHRP
jgi:hypothetical protein